MRICIIGNSHCNAIKHGAALTESPLSGNLTFIAAPGMDLRLEISENEIIPKSERNYVSYATGLDSSAIKITDYDTFVVTGLAMTVHQTLRLHEKGYRLFKYHEANRKLISRSAFKAALSGLLNENPGIEVARELRIVTERPIFVSAQPIPVDKIRTFNSDVKQHSDVIERWRPTFDLNLARDLEEIFNETMREILEENKIEFLPQPDVTRGDFFTKNHFQLQHQLAFSSPGSKKNQIEDLVHMNADYGAAVLDQILLKLRPKENIVE